MARLHEYVTVRLASGALQSNGYTPHFSEHPEDDPAKIELDTMQEDLLQLQTIMINYALERGYSYQRWQTVASAILFKDKDNHRIHRTRVIHLYEADYNLMIGLKWSYALYQAESLHILNKGQFGSRPNRNAHDPVILEELQFEISRATRKSLVQVNYDATSCYDRIVPNLAMLASRKNCVPFTATQVNSSALEKATYCIKTDLGVAPTGYAHCTEYPVYGTGQDSGNSPAIWCFVSSLLFDCYDKMSTGAEYCLHDRTEQFSVNMVGFVDDSNGQTNCFTSDIQWTESELQDAVQNDAQAWTDLLAARGGALELPKCCYHFLRWCITDKGHPVLIGPAALPDITVTDHQTQQSQVLEKLSPYTAHKTLGSYKEPSGNQKAQFRALQDKSNSITNFLRHSQVSPQEALIYYHSTYLSGMKYALAVSCLSFRQLDKIQRQAMNLIIPKCG